MRRKSSKKLLGLAMGIACLTAAAFPGGAWGAEAADSAVEIKLKSGSPSLTINGEAIAIVAPYEQNGTTMVPLRVITEAFGADLTYKKGVIGLTYGSRSIVLTIGSNKVTVNGTVTEVPVAPALINNGTTYVPLRVIAEAFGADVSFDPATKLVTIAGGASGQTESSATGEQSEAAQIGSSYDGWQIHDPGTYGLRKQTVNGTRMTFTNTDGTANLVIDAEVAEEQLTTADIQDSIRFWFEDGEEIVSEDTVTANGLQYTQILTAWEGTVSLYRAVQKDDLLYTIIMFTEGTDAAQLEPYKALLDSFELNFNASGATDLVGDYKTYHYESGISITVPQYWFSMSGGVTAEEALDFYYFHDGYLFMQELDASALETGDADFDGTGEINESLLAALPSVTIDGKQAAWLEEESEEYDGTDYYYFIENGDSLLVVSFFIANGPRAEANLAAAKDAVMSMTIEEAFR